VTAQRPEEGGAESPRDAEDPTALTAEEMILLDSDAQVDGVARVAMNQSSNIDSKPSADYTLNSSADQLTQRSIFSASCEIITPSTNSTCKPAYGLIEVTSTKIIFTKRGPPAITKPAIFSLPGGNNLENAEYLWACQSFDSTHWATDDILNIFPRTFYLRQTAVEVFFSSRRSVFINLRQKHLALQFIFAIRYLVKPAHIQPYFGSRPQNIISKMVVPGSETLLTIAWENREISNFEYLMYLNTIAGRSYNDLGQYPVFPWIIADYVSSELKLREVSTFRDLRWPMGAQKERQRDDLMRKYEDIEDMYKLSLDGDSRGQASLPPFHFGSHYSTAGFVMWYLMRCEPYTSLHVQLQDGKFDKTDRLFDTIEAAWRGCIDNPSDVKELIPEFFYCPEIFENINQLDLGVKHSTRRSIGDIVLPPWASDPFEFVRLNRKALESEYVSRNLHHWIDLIFGYKQRPPYLRGGGSQATVEACNVFFHLTYAGAVNLEELLEMDRVLYDQYVNQIAEFGQTPAQLFTTPHPQRLPLDQADISWPIASCVLGADTVLKGDVLPDKPRKIICFRSYKVSMWPVVFIGEIAERMITVDTSRIIGNHTWQTVPQDVIPPYRLRVDTAALELSNG
jgi:hypothetical protein